MTEHHPRVNRGSSSAFQGIASRIRCASITPRYPWRRPPPVRLRHSRSPRESAHTAVLPSPPPDEPLRPRRSPACQTAECWRQLVGALFRLAAAIERHAATAKAHTDKLTQAILAKAFRGELVPTEVALARREGRPTNPPQSCWRGSRPSGPPHPLAGLVGERVHHDAGHGRPSHWRRFRGKSVASDPPLVRCIRRSQGPRRVHCAHPTTGARRLRHRSIRPRPLLTSAAPVGPITGSHCHLATSCRPGCSAPATVDHLAD